MGGVGQFIVNIKGFNKDQGHKLKVLKQGFLLFKKGIFTSKVIIYDIPQPTHLCSKMGSVYKVPVENEHSYALHFT